VKVTQKKLVVPIDLIRYCTQNKLVDELQLLLFLKFYSPGKIPKYKYCESVIMSGLGIRKKDTLRKRFKKLIALKWIGYDHFHDVVFLRSFPFLFTILNLKSLKGTFLDELEQFKIFNPWVTAALIGEAIQRQRWKRKLTDRFNRTRSKQGQVFSPSFHLGLSNQTIAKILNVSITQARRYKNEAAEYKLLIVTKKFIPVHSNTEDLNLFKMAYPEFRNKAKLIDGKIHLQSYDEILNVLRFKKRRYLLKHSKIKHLPKRGTIINSGIGLLRVDSP
jgi:hypothetical protein